MILKRIRNKECFLITGLSLVLSGSLSGGNIVKWHCPGKCKRSTDLGSLSAKLEKYSSMLPVNTENNMNKENITYKMVSNCIKQSNLKEYLHVILSHFQHALPLAFRNRRFIFLLGVRKKPTTDSPLC